MSLEESMAKLAESNLKLAEAQAALAVSQQAVADKYDEMIAFVVANGASEVNVPAKKAAAEKTEEAPKRGRGRPKKEAAPAKTEDDGLGSDDGLGGDEDEDETDEAPQRTSDEVKALLKEFKEKGGVPRDIMSKFGAKAFPELKESDFNAVYEMTEKALGKL